MLKQRERKLSADNSKKPCLKRSSSLSTNGSVSSSFESLASRKSVSFADSIGEDLCRIRTFNLESEEEPWWMKHPWYRQEIEEEEEEEEEDDEDLLFSNYCYAYDDHCHIELKDIQEEELSEDNQVVLPTFISPVDLPGYETNLAERIICIRDLNVLSGNQGIQLTGSLNKSSTAKDAEPVELNVRYSLDGWSTSQDLSTVSRISDDQTHHTFEILNPSREMNVGDDLELYVIFNYKENDVAIIDDNSGMKYRFICKNKSKFTPGKSLW